MLRKVLVLALLLTSAPAASAAPTYLFPITGCKVDYAHAHHDYPATDILTKAGCTFISPIDGTVDEVNRKDSWSGKTNLGADRGGLFVSIIGVDGVRYYGSHLRSIPATIVPGLAVKAGDVLGAVGATGSARGTHPHLHFGISWPTPAGIWWVRRGEVLPWKYLDAWNSGKDLSPAKAVAALKAKKGEVPAQPKK
jgi:murein DD-endopeptidase MepM/ murein hydrolase activator NlpD